MVDIEIVYDESGIFYFVTLVFIGAYILINLTLVIIKSALTNSITALKHKKKSQKTHEFIETDKLIEQLKRKHSFNIDEPDISEFSNEYISSNLKNSNGFLKASYNESIKGESPIPELNKANSINSEDNGEDAPFNRQKLANFL